MPASSRGPTETHASVADSADPAFGRIKLSIVGPGDILIAFLTPEGLTALSIALADYERQIVLAPDTPAVGFGGVRL